MKDNKKRQKIDGRAKAKRNLPTTRCIENYFLQTAALSETSRMAR